jgi:Aldehyde dehydrogenase family
VRCSLALASKFRNAGQTCVCANRLLVQDRVYGAFADKLTRAVAELRVGDGFEDGVEIGPLIDEAACQKVEAHIADALAKGATIAVGGKRDARGGLFFAPTVLTGVTSRMTIAREETFGPVAPLFRFTYRSMMRATRVSYHAITDAISRSESPAAKKRVAVVPRRSWRCRSSPAERTDLFQLALNPDPHGRFCVLVSAVEALLGISSSKLLSSR